VEFSQDEIKVLKPMNLITAKNVVYLANISQKMLENKKVPKHAAALHRHLKNMDPEAPLILFSASVESHEILDKIVFAGYDALGLMNFFTAGEDEVRSWTVREGTSAPDAGAVIHTDFKTGFVAVDVISYSDLESLGSEQEVKARGLCRLKGKDYVVQDGDVLHFRAGRIQKK
jgi:ribosome-binding ATPase YchF (GTP1/OBG family)